MASSVKKCLDRNGLLIKMYLCILKMPFNMKTFILNLSDPATAKLVYHTTFLEEVSVLCMIPSDTDCLKVIGTIDFKNVVFDKKFYKSIKSKINILDLSALKSSTSYESLRLGLNDGLKYGFQAQCFEKIILPSQLRNMPMIRNLPELRIIVGLGLITFDNENLKDYISESNLSRCPKLEEIIFGSSIKTISIRNSSIKRINIPESNGLLQLEPYGFAYNNELEEVHIPQDIKKLPIRLFEGCKNMKRITGGKGLEEIGFGAFGGCVNLHCVPFRINLLKESQFLSHDEWMQYEPYDHHTSMWYRGDCSHCPKGKWSKKIHGWEEGCRTKKYYCRDNEQRKWKPYKKGVILKNGYIWCFNDFTYYKTDIRFDWWDNGSDKVHHYVEFIAPCFTFASEEDHVNIICDSKEKRAQTLTFPHNELAEIIDFFFEDISYELIVDEITRKVNELDINVIIDSYKTSFSHESFKMNSDTYGESYELDRSAMYTDEYLIKLLPTIHEYQDDRTAALLHYSDYKNPYKTIFDFKHSYSTFDKKEGANLQPSFPRTGNIFRDSADLKNKDAEIRKKAREKYCKRDHVDYLVNCRISEIINKKLEIESRLHIKQAENEFYAQNK